MPYMPSVFTKEVFSAKVKCPCCASEMARATTDNPHDHYVGNFICQNRNCNVHITVRN